MTTQYTTILKLALPVQGELSGTWGDVVNDNITQMVEQAVAGKAVVNTWTGNSHTLTTADGTTSESRCAILELTDSGTALTGAGTVVCPTNTKLYIVDNNTAEIITVQTVAGTGVAVPVGKTMLVYCDGTNVVEGVTHANSLSLGTSTVTADKILDEDNMASDSATAIATQQSIKAYVDSQVGTVDTLSEILANGNTTGANDIDVDSAQKVQFRDAAIYINSSVDGQLDIVADGEVQIDTALVDINGNLDVSGTTNISGSVSFTKNAIAGVAISTTSRSSNTVTVTTSAVHGLTSGDLVNVNGVADTSFNGYFTVSVSSTTVFTYNQTGADGSSTGGTSTEVVYNLNASGTALNWMNGPLNIAANSGIDGLEITQSGAGNGLHVTGTTGLVGNTTLTGNLDVSGTALVTGVLTTTAATVFNGGFASNADSTLGTDKKVQFRDSAIYINSSVDGQLDIVADTEIQIAATTVDLNGNLDVSGTTVSAGKITADAGIDIDNINIDGTTIALSSGDLTLDAAGDIILDADGGDIHFYDGGIAHGNFLLSGTDFTIGSSQNNGDLIFRGIDGGADVTALTLDMSAAGAATFNAGATFGGGITTTGNAAAGTASAGDGRLFPNNTYGAFVYGNGTTYDVALGQRSTGVALGVLAGTTDVVIPTGNVGIGVAPAARFDVMATGSNQWYIRNTDGSAQDNTIVSLRSGGYSNIALDGASVQFKTEGGVRMTIAASGAITTTSSATFGGNVIIPAASILYFDGGGDTFMREPSANIVQVNTAGAVAMTIDATQNVTIEGYVYPNSGIYLGGTTAANLLDSYEEGDWTPAFANIGTGTYTHQVGRYTKVGNLVTASVHIDINVLGTASGSVDITNLPFTASAVSNNYGSASSIHAQNFTTAAEGLNVLINPNTAVANVFSGSGATSAAVNLTHAVMGTGNLLCTLVYFTA
jgi:hypothetical protein